MGAVLFAEAERVCEAGDGKEPQNQPGMVIDLHAAVHVQPGPRLLRGGSMLQHPVGFGREHVIKVIGEETGCEN